MRGLLGLTLLAAVCVAAPPPEHINRTFKASVVLTGINSQIEKPAFIRCLNQDEWKTTWDKHAGEDSFKTNRMPEVNCDDNMVVAIFHGKGAQNYGYEIHPIDDEKNFLRIRYKMRTYQVMAIGDGTDDFSKYKTQSYAFIVMPKSTKEIVFEEDVHTGIGDPPVWKEKSRLNAVR
jgi:hypothetical protein